MDFFKKLIEILTLKMDEPGNYGWFHLLFIGLLVIACLGVIFLANHHHQEKTLKLVLLICGSVMIIFEIYKQLVFTFRLNGNQLVIDYQWYAFPFQLCSTPMYIMIIAALFKPGKARDALLGYLALFGLFGGLCVYIFPNDVFVSEIGIDIQTMIHHGLQIVVGVFLLAYYRRSYRRSFWLGSFAVFAITFSIALTLDFVIPHFINETFNMFYISQQYGCTLPVLSAIYPKVPYIVFLLIYGLGFCLAASVIYWLSFSINLLCKTVYRGCLKLQVNH